MTNDPASDTVPAWSPDGTRIAFVSDRDGNAEIYTMSAADGSAATRLTSTPSAVDSDPVWSRDGKLAFISAQDEFSDLWVIETSGPRALTINDRVYSPVWSPDSKRIAYTGEIPIDSGREEVFSIRADGTDEMQYTVNGGKVRGITWSPGGLWLVYADDSSGNFDLYTIRASGIGVVRLTPTRRRCIPSWPPTPNRLTTRHHRAQPGAGHPHTRRAGPAADLQPIRRSSPSRTPRATDQPDPGELLGAD
jgi:Tol biopolymer transport system component